MGGGSAGSGIGGGSEGVESGSLLITCSSVVVIDVAVDRYPASVRFTHLRDTKSYV